MLEAVFNSAPGREKWQTCTQTLPPETSTGPAPSSVQLPNPATPPFRADSRRVPGSRVDRLVFLRTNDFLILVLLNRTPLLVSPVAFTPGEKDTDDGDNPNSPIDEWPRLAEVLVEHQIQQEEHQKRAKVPFTKSQMYPMTFTPSGPLRAFNKLKQWR